MATYKDIVLELGNYNKMTEYTDASAFVLAVRNILLSKPGNFPFTPGLGLDIEKYLFRTTDPGLVSEIKTDLNAQLQYIPDAQNVTTEVQVVEDDSDGDTKYILGISVSATVNGESVTTNFLLYKEYDILNVYNETY